MDSHYKAEEEIAGNSEALEALREIIIYPLLYADEFRILGIKRHIGILLYGPTGTGKTTMVKAVAQECGAHLITISCESVGEGDDEFLKKAFAETFSHASSSGQPSVIFLDGIDAICPRRDNWKEQGSRPAGQLLSLMNQIRRTSVSRTASGFLTQIVVVAATNWLDGIDPTLRRRELFGKEIEVPIPNAGERLQILVLHSKDIYLDHCVDLEAIAASCNGYAGSDLKSLCEEAARYAYRRVSNTDAINGGMIKLTMQDWDRARAGSCPSMTKGVAIEQSTKVTWDDIGGYRGLKKELQQVVEWPIKHADGFARLGISPIRGVLLHGLPGCSKTTLAMAAAHAAQASFFSFSCAQLFSKYVGDGEAFLRRIFQKARLASPSIIFFDEVDAIAPKRGDGGDSNGNHNVGERLLFTLLTEMDGLEQATGVTVLAATNRPEAIDSALLRPGRFDLVLYVPTPDLEDRYEILRVHTRKMPLGEDVNLMQVAKSTELFTGAELKHLCTEAGLLALKKDMSAEFVCDRHFQHVTKSLKPDLTKSKINDYEQSASRFTRR